MPKEVTGFGAVFACIHQILGLGSDEWLGDLTVFADTVDVTASLEKKRNEVPGKSDCM